MNDIYLLEKAIDNLENECYQLNQQIHEMYDNVKVPMENDKVIFNSYPTPMESSLNENRINTLSSYDENFPDNNQTLALIPNIKTFDPIMASDGISQTVPNESETIDNETLFKMLMAIQKMNNNTHFIENAPLGNGCNDIDVDLFQHLLSMQENSVNSSIPMDMSVESILTEIQNNHVSLLESSNSDSDEDTIRIDNSLEKYMASNNDLQTILHIKFPS